MIRKPTDTQVVGLHLDGPFLKLAQIDSIRGVVKVKRLEEFSLSQNEEKLNFLVAGEEKICGEICDRYLTVASLQGQETLVRKLKIKLTKDKDIEAALPFEAEGALPFSSEEGIIDKVIVDKEEGLTHLTLIGCKKTALAHLLSEFQSLNLDPEVVATLPTALAAFAGRYTHFEEELVVLFIGERSSLSAIVKNGKLLSSHSINQGLDTLKKRFIELQESLSSEEGVEKSAYSLQNFDFGQSDLPQALARHPEALAALEKLKQEVTWMLLSEMKGLKDKEHSALLSVGEGANLKGLDAYLYNEIELPRLELDTKDGIELNQNLLRKFAVAIGSALTLLPKYPNPINLRQEELSYPDPWKRLKGTLTVFAGSSLVLAFLIFLLGQAYLGYKEDLLRENYGSLLASLNKSYSGYEKEYLSKHPSESEEEVPLKELSLSALRDRLTALEGEFKSSPDLYPLLPNMPQVSDVLAWLTHHPLMNSEEGSLKIDNFTYQMVKRPDIAKKGEKYQVKVDLELTAPSAKMAREFHTALNSPNNFVDPKSEVKWSNSRGKYQASFFLKDKTSYNTSNNP